MWARNCGIAGQVECRFDLMFHEKLVVKQITDDFLLFRMESGITYYENSFYSDRYITICADHRLDLCDLLQQLFNMFKIYFIKKSTISRIWKVIGCVDDWIE